MLAESVYPYSVQNNAEHAEIVHIQIETPCWHLIIQWLEFLTSSKSDSLPEWAAIDAVISVEFSVSWSVKLSGDCIQVHVAEQCSYQI